MKDGVKEKNSLHVGSFSLSGTTRQPRDGEISGVDYNFVSIEEFFSLEESGALLESGKFQGGMGGLQNKSILTEHVTHEPC